MAEFKLKTEFNWVGKKKIKFDEKAWVTEDALYNETIIKLGR